MLRKPVFQGDKLSVYTIHRSLSPGNFFIGLKTADERFDTILIVALYNPFSEFICGCSTVWNPDFDQMKTLLLLGVWVIEEISEEDRYKLLKSEDELIEFGTYIFDTKRYKFIIDNKQQTINLLPQF